MKEQNAIENVVVPMTRDTILAWTFNIDYNSNVNQINNIENIDQLVDFFFTEPS